MGCTAKSDAVVLSEEYDEGQEAGRGKAEGEIFMVFEAPGHDSWRGGTYA